MAEGFLPEPLEMVEETKKTCYNNSCGSEAMPCRRWNKIPDAGHADGYHMPQNDRKDV